MMTSPCLALPPNKRLKLAARRLWNESFFSAPQRRRDPLDGALLPFLLGEDNAPRQDLLSGNTC
jgi:hypothetical protein